MIYLALLFAIANLNTHFVSGCFRACASILKRRLR